MRDVYSRALRTRGTHPVALADDGALADHGSILGLLPLRLEIRCFHNRYRGWQYHGQDVG